MRNTIKIAGAAIALSMATTGCMSMDGDMMDDDVAYVDGAAMYASKNIVENAMESPIHTTLVAAVKQAQLVDTLMGPGPFTVFAPTDEAFSRVPQATLNAVMMDENRPLLQKVLTYHVVPGSVTSADLVKLIREGGGKAMVTTVEGGQLTFTLKDGNVMIMGQNGSSAWVTQADVMQSNGVIHVVNGVLMPAM
ncbi:fasciclin domain-containing protein [Pseudoblastomonas halimionae]|uniref:Fasciclin domain-containing protein n=1 Tax=Alteriqipengyuania halimionae TaxID=1926630 RepID=A0A6I4U458_9SPHN|nr:fasciclin domain-containing protein [Alteriqipengyuania halimionae]MXP09027.1 fasciclin domain-containing protein [Alteriqipengyuania halimionae]